MKKIISAIVFFSAIFLFSSFCEAAGYVGSNTCYQCYAGKYNNFIISGHSYK